MEGDNECRCKKCGNVVNETLKHFIFECTHLSALRDDYNELFTTDTTNVHEFFKRDAVQLMSFAAKCYKRMSEIS